MEFMNFSNNEIRKVITHVSSRWLSLGKFLEKCNGTLWDSLMQRDSLKSFVLSNFDLDNAPTENNPDEKPIRENKIGKSIQTTC